MHVGAPEVVFVIIVPIVLGVIAIWRVVKRKSAQNDSLEAKRLEVMNALINKFENVSDLTEFLNSDAGKRMTEALSVGSSNAPTRSVVLIILAAVCFWYGVRMVIGPLALLGLSGGLGHLPLIWCVGITGFVLVVLAVYFAWLSKIWK